jgi:hypothetical protein
MSNVIPFRRAAPKSSISPEEAEEAMQRAIYCLLSVWGPKQTPVALEDLAARLRENLI